MYPFGPVRVPVNEDLEPQFYVNERPSIDLVVTRVPQRVTSKDPSLATVLRSQ